MIDARGRSCPEPVIMIKKETEQHPEESAYEILVDNRVSVENISRFAASRKLHAEVTDKDGDYLLRLTRSQ